MDQDNKVKKNKSALKEHSNSTCSFWICGSSTKKKKSNQINSNNSAKVQSVHSSINDLAKNKEKESSNIQDPIPSLNKIDDSSKNTMNFSSIEKISNQQMQNKQNNQEQSYHNKNLILEIKEEEQISSIKEDDIQIDVNKSIPIILENYNNLTDNQRPKNSIADREAIIESESNEMKHKPIIMDKEISIDISKDNKPQEQSIKQNLENKFNAVHKDLNTKRSELDNDRIFNTEITPRRFNNSLYDDSHKANFEANNALSTRNNKYVKSNVDVKKLNPLNDQEINGKENLMKNLTNGTNVIQSPIATKIEVVNNPQINGISKEAIESFKEIPTDAKIIGNQISPPQIEAKQITSRAMVNDITKKLIEKTPNSNIINSRHSQSLSSPSFTEPNKTNIFEPQANLSNPNMTLKSQAQVQPAFIQTPIIQSQAQIKSQVISPEQPLPEPKVILNYINNNYEEESKVNASDFDDNNYYVDDDDELKDGKESLSNKFSETHSIISSYVLTVPKMISGINESYAPSVYTRSEYKETTSNFLPTESTNNLRLIPTNIDDTEFEITNENGEGFRNFIETPRTSNMNLKKSNRDCSNGNPQFKEIYDKINHKEKDIKRMNEKISKLMSDIQKCEEENKKYDRWIEKEESDGEMLRHMLNFLNSK